jgi:hypothetical protein
VSKKKKLTAEEEEREKMGREIIEGVNYYYENNLDILDELHSPTRETQRFIKKYSSKAAKLLHSGRSKCWLGVSSRLFRAFKKFFIERNKRRSFQFKIL